MTTFKKDTSFEEHKQKITDAASDIVNEGKEYVSELYEEGCYHLDEAQRIAKEYSDQMLIKVQRNPLSSVLIAAGVGFFLSTLLRK
jgi:ElaB/YqjD/DUF883 family membrane-anchored ribosome-binding protein